MPAPTLLTLHKSQRDNLHHKATVPSAVPPNIPCIITHILPRDFTKDKPTIASGSQYIPSGPPAVFEKQPWPEIFHYCYEGKVDQVARLLEMGKAKVNARNPRVSGVGVRWVVVVVVVVVVVIGIYHPTKDGR